MGQDEAGTLARLKLYRRELIDAKIAEHKGRLVKTTGDGMLIEFPSVVEAVACALAIRRGMDERNAAIPQDEAIRFRVGINLGDVIVEGDDIYGDGVNVAARLEALAQPGGICISGIVPDQVEGGSIAPSIIWVSRVSRTSQSRCASIGCVRKARLRQQPRRWRCPISRRSRCCRSPT
jgi:class 3 adenylate cyclase